MLTEERLITVHKSAEILGHTVQHIRLLIRQRKLKGQKIGRDWMLSSDAVFDYQAKTSSLPLFPKSILTVNNDKQPLFKPKAKTNTYYLYYKDGKIIKPIESVELNKQAKVKLSYIYKNKNGNIPEYYLNNWDKVALFHTAGDVKKANAILINPENGAYSLRNKLNDLTGKEWTKFSCSWLRFNALQSDLQEERRVDPNSQDHPATFSPTMIEEFIRYFTKKGQKVLDPFCGMK